jgi:protease I
MPSLDGKKILYIIAQRNFRDEEFSIPKQMLEKEGARVTVASETTEEARGMLGLRVKPDISIIEANPNNFDALIIAGGSGSPKLADLPEVLNLIRRFNSQNKVIAAICLAPYILARAGILRERTVTAFPEDFVLTELKRMGAVYDSGPVVVDNNIITADGPQSAREFGEQIAKVLSEKA